MKFIKKNIVFQALDQSPVAILLIDAESSSRSIVYANQAIAELLDINPVDVIGCHFDELLAEGRWICDGVAPQVFMDQQKWKGRKGPTNWLDVRIMPLYDPAEHVAFWQVSVVHEHEVSAQGHKRRTLSSELRDARRQIRSLQRTDAVTGLANAAMFDEVLQRDWAIARREQRCIGLIVFEVDSLPAYRDIYGRHATDSLLRKIGHAINGTLRRAGDLAARLDDGRFAVLMGSPDGSHIEAFATGIAAKVRNLAIHHPRSVRDRFVTMTFASAAEVPDQIASTPDLMAQAINALPSAAVLNVAGPEHTPEPESLI
ncbi:MAG: GGDEF domain-containing protein [Gammaproteobacteria bacterium]|nr:GGDEF domain-containing protein [Gammaproteobacteria bacterium]